MDAKLPASETEAAPTSPAAGTGAPGAGPLGGVSLRAFLIGAAWMAIIAVLIPYNDYYLQSTFITGNLLPLGAVLILAVMILFVNLFWQVRLIGSDVPPW